MPQKYAKEGNGHKYTIGIKLRDTSKQLSFCSSVYSTMC